MGRPGATVWLVAAMLAATAAYAQEKPGRIMSLGPYTLGTKLSEVPSEARGECRRSPDDCTFAAGGVHYIVSQREVATATANATSTKVTLPFGLKFGESVAAAKQKLGPSVDSMWTTFDEGKETLLISKRRYAGRNGWSFDVYLKFISNRLAEVKYYTQYI